MGAKVLITGADGFIGSHLTELLVEKGYEVRAFAFYNSFNTWGWLDTLPASIMDHVEVFTGDIRDPNGVREAVKGCGCFPSGCADCHSLQLLFAGLLCGHKYQGYAECAPGRPGFWHGARADHIHVRSVWHGTLRSH